MPRKKKDSAVQFLKGVILLAVIGYLLGNFSLQREVDPHPPLPLSVDVIVLGSGITGATAVLSAAEAGVDVFYLYQDEPAKGGFPAFSPAFWASGLPVQEKAGMDYPAEMMASAIYQLGQETGDFEYILSFSKESGSSLLWLESITGVPFSLFAEPKSNPGLLLPKEGEAARFVDQKLTERVVAAVVGSSRIRKPGELLIQNGRVRGMVVQTADGKQLEIFAPAIILADGGYGSNQELLKEWAEISSAAPRPEDGHYGIGLLLAKAAGAKTSYLDRVMLLPVFLPEGNLVVQGGFPDAVVLSIDGGKVVPGEKLSQTISDAGGKLLIIYGSERPQAEPWFSRIDDLQSLASGLALDFETAASLTRELTAPYFVAVIATVALTPGGLVVDRQMRVLTASGVMEGLYAAGEITAGLHGSSAISSLFFSEAVTTARLAGEQAAAWARR